MKRILVLATLAVTALSSASVRAADLPQKPVYKAPMAAPGPVYNWTGCYIGANIGGAWGNINATDVTTGASVSPRNSGFAGGGQVGCDYQMGQWVVGVRNIIDGTSISNGAAISDGVIAGTVNSHLHWFDALTARAGFLVQPNILLYGQGGAAWTSWDVTAFNGAGAQVGEISGGNRTGWTAGVGAEWMFAPHWSVFLEYNFMGFGSRSATTTACVGGRCALISAKSDLQNALVGVNYKF
jgi:outer membrane immunogenic protein